MSLLGNRPLAAAVVLLVVLPGCGDGRPSASKSASGGGSSAVKPSPPRRVAALVPPASPSARSVSVPVLTYHRVNHLRAGANEIETDLTVEPNVFAAEMRVLKETGFHAVSQERLFDALYRRARLPHRPVLITVDDGYIDDLRNVLPVLKRNGLTATFFVITGREHIGGFMNADQIRELDRAGMDVGDHTHTHVDLRIISAAARAREIAGSRRELQGILGHPVYFFAYPFGKYDDTVISAVRHAGFTIAYTTVGATTESTTAPLTMPRLHVGRTETPSGLLSLLGR